MAGSFIQGKGFQAGGTAAPTASFDTDVTVGSAILVFGGHVASASQTITGVTDNNGNTYSQIIAPMASDASGLKSAAVWIATGCNAGPTTVTITYSSATNVSGIVLELGGIGSSPFDQTNFALNFSGAGSISSGNVTTTSANEYVLGLLYFDSAETVTAGSGYTSRFSFTGSSFGDQFTVQDKNLSTTTTLDSSASKTGFSDWLNVIVTLKQTVVGPTINTQPSDATVTAGATATFSVSATASAGSLSYQWNDASGPISGATSSSYTTPTLSVGDSGDHFWCTVTDTNGSIDTRHALLTVNAAGPTINTQPSDATVVAPNTATFSVTATTSGGSLSYQWNNDGGAISGATSSTYTTPATSGTDDGTHFWCSVTDSNGTVDTSHATLHVNVPGSSIVIVLMM